MRIEAWRYNDAERTEGVWSMVGVLAYSGLIVIIVRIVILVDHNRFSRLSPLAPLTPFDGFFLRGFSVPET